MIKFFRKIRQQLHSENTAIQSVLPNKKKKIALQEFYEFLNNDINLFELGQWIYENTELENIIGADDYLTLIAFNYNKKRIALDVQNFIFKNLISEKEFSYWKVNKLFESINVEIPDVNIYQYAKQQPDFLKGRQLRFKNYWSKNKIEIFWTDSVSQVIGTNNEKYLYLGTYENSYIHLVANQKGEIWLDYDIIAKQDFWAKNLKEAIAKLFISQPE